MKKIHLRKFQPKRTFGVELEFSRDGIGRSAMKTIIERAGENAKCTGYQRNDDSQYWFCKPDSSCGNEVASKVLGSMDSINQTIQDLKLLERIHLALIRGGAIVNRSCGMHVHLGMGDMGDSKMQRFLLWWIRFEKLIFDLLPRRRVGNQYCNHHSRHFRPNRRYTGSEIRSAFSGRSAVNLGAFDWRRTPRSGNTIEIRAAEGTNDPRNVKNWVRFLLYFVDFTKEADRPTITNYVSIDEGLELLGLLTPKHLASQNEVVLSPALSELREWMLARTAAYAKFRDAEKTRALAAGLHAQLYPTPYGCTEEGQ